MTNKQLYNKVKDISKNPEDLLRFAEISDRNYTVVNDPEFLREISERDFHHQVDNLHDYRILAGREAVTRDSPNLIGLDTALERASKIHDLILIKQFIDQGARNWYMGLLGAASGGHVDLINYYLSAGEKFTLFQYNLIMVHAAMSGSIEIIAMMLGKGANNYDDTLRAVLDANPKNNVKEIVELMLERGAKNVLEALEISLFNHEISLNIITLLIDDISDVEELNKALHIVVTDEQRDIEEKIVIVNYLIQKGANDYDTAIANAMNFQNVKMANYLRSKRNGTSG